MPDNWGFVVAAYALAAVVLGGYWRRLRRRERELGRAATSRPGETTPAAPAGSGARR